MQQSFRRKYKFIYTGRWQRCNSLKRPEWDSNLCPQSQETSTLGHYVCTTEPLQATKYAPQSHFRPLRIHHRATSIKGLFVYVNGQQLKPFSSGPMVWLKNNTPDPSKTIFPCSSSTDSPAYFCRSQHNLYLGNFPCIKRRLHMLFSLSHILLSQRSCTSYNDLVLWLCL